MESLYSIDDKKSFAKMSVVGLKARVRKEACTACGCCEKVCPVKAVSLALGGQAEVDKAACIGCMRCLRACPESAIRAG